MAKLTKTQQKNIAAARANQKEMNYGQRELAKLFSTPEASKTKVHADGTVENLGSVTTEQMVHFLKGRRAFDGIEALEEINRWTLNYLVQNGYARPVKQARNPKNDMYMITKKAAEQYRLPNVTTMGLTFKFVD